MTIDPRFGFWFSIVMTIVATLGVCGAYFTTLFGTHTSELILAGLAILNAINSAINAILHAIPSKPGSGNDFALGPKVAPVIILALILGALAFPGDAQAQVKLKTPEQVVNDIKRATGQTAAAITGKPAPDPAPVDVWKAIMTAALPDLVYSSALANSAGTLASKVRKQCWDAIIAVNKQSQGTDLKDDQGHPLVKPDLHFFTDVELLAETIDNLSPTGPLFTSCAGAAEMAKMSVLQFISTAVTGAAGFAAMGL